MQNGNATVEDQMVDDEPSSGQVRTLSPNLHSALCGGGVGKG